MKGGYSRRADLSAYTERQDEIIREKSLLEKTLDAHALDTRHSDTSMSPQTPPLTATQENTSKILDRQVQNVPPEPPSLVLEETVALENTPRLTESIVENRNPIRPTELTQRQDTQSCRPRRVTGKPDWYGIDTLQSLTNLKINENCPEVPPHKKISPIQLLVLK